MLGELRGRSRLAAEAVERVKRSDARLARARLLLVLHETAPPFGQDLRVSWYEAGAVSRASPETLARMLWRRFGDRPDPRTVRRHLAWCEDRGLVIRAPGAPHGLGRHADTLHVARTAAEAEWWRRRGLRRMRRRGAARTCLEAWLLLFGNWRERVAAIVRRLEGRGATAPVPAPRPTRASLEAAILDGTSSEILRALSGAGIRLRTGWRFAVRRSRERLAAAAAMLLERVRAVGWPADPGGWLVWAWRRGGAAAHAALHGLRREAEAGAAETLAGLGLGDLVGTVAGQGRTDGRATSGNIR